MPADEKITPDNKTTDGVKAKTAAVLCFIGTLELCSEPEAPIESKDFEVNIAVALPEALFTEGHER